MDIIRLEDLAQTPWKNGGGLTRQIAAAFEGEAMLWRLSLADVAQDGAFSSFPGLCRILTVLTGAGLRLEHGTEVMLAEPWTPLRFDGGLGIFGRLTAGPVSDFNLMFDPDRCAANVAVLRGRHVQDLTEDMAIHCLAGVPSVGIMRIGRGDTILVKGDVAPLTLAAEDAVLLVTFGYLDQRDLSKRVIVLR